MATCSHTHTTSLNSGRSDSEIGEDADDGGVGQRSATRPIQRAAIVSLDAARQTPLETLDNSYDLCTVDESWSTYTERSVSVRNSGVVGRGRLESEPDRL